MPNTEPKVCFVPVFSGLPYDGYMGDDGVYYNSFGEPWKDKLTHPYNYDPIYVFRKNTKTTSKVLDKHSVYHDRMMQWDYIKFQRCSKTVFGSHTSNFDHLPPNQIEKFLRMYFEDDTLQLFAIVEYCNPSNGFPYWRFDYQTDKV